MLDQTTIRRRQDGSIDTDFYRQHGVAERRAVMKRALRRVGKRGKAFAFLVIVTSVLSGMFAATGTASPTPT